MWERLENLLVKPLHKYLEGKGERLRLQGTKGSAQNGVYDGSGEDPEDVRKWKHLEGLRSPGG